MNTDFLVIGSGVAGLWYALRMAKHGRVTVITKKSKAESNTNYAQGGIAAVMSSHDNFESHIEDTLKVGAGICDHEVVEQVVREGPNCVYQLISMGARFSYADDKLHLAREGGHSAPRIVHHADMTGREIERVLLNQLATDDNITLLEHHFCMDLLTDKGHCLGALVLDTVSGKCFNLAASTTLLASGGCGWLFQYTTNPAVATGDGVAMAWRAGAQIANMEFIQFHPTSLYHEGESVFLISEAVRGAGAFLINKDGERFMQGYHPLGDLAPRDIVARSIDKQLKTRGDDCVYLDATHLPETEVKSHFSNIAETCLHYGIDMLRQPIPVVPAAHYQCGGVLTDKKARTSLTGLLACGEVAYTGLHGANRLASNSLLEALAFSTYAVETSLKEYTSPKNSPIHPPVCKKELLKNIEEIEKIKQFLRHLMWQKVGIVRTTESLQQVANELTGISEKVDSLWEDHSCVVAICELRNMLTNAKLIVQSALMRKESRGLHSIKEFPALSKQFEGPTILAQIRLPL